MKFSARVRVVPIVLVAALWAGQGAAAGTPVDVGAPVARVTGAWARSTPPGARNGVVYLRVTSERADRLVGVTVASDVAAGAELHASMGGAAGSGGGHAGHGSGGGGSGATMEMKPLPSVRLPAGRTVVFAPGGRHVMLVDLARTLARGDRFPLALQFERGPEQIVTVRVRDTAP